MEVSYENFWVQNEMKPIVFDGVCMPPTKRVCDNYPDSFLLFLLETWEGRETQSSNFVCGFEKTLTLCFTRLLGPIRVSKKHLFVLYIKITQNPFFHFI